MLLKERWLVIYNSSSCLVCLFLSLPGGDDKVAGKMMRYRNWWASPPEMLVDKNDEDEEEVGGHSQDPDTGQENSADCVLLENK